MLPQGNELKLGFAVPVYISTAIWQAAPELHGLDIRAAGVEADLQIYNWGHALYFIRFVSICKLGFPNATQVPLGGVNPPLRT
jgi:hypothetical protein